MDASKFVIPDEIQAKYPDLVKLVVGTESMDDNEKQYWFDILPQMNDEQVDRLFTILDTERIKLAECERRYQEELAALEGRLRTEADALFVDLDPKAPAHPLAS